MRKKPEPNYIPRERVNSVKTDHPFYSVVINGQTHKIPFLVAELIQMQAARIAELESACTRASDETRAWKQEVDRLTGINACPGCGWDLPEHSPQCPTYYGQMEW